MYYKKTTSSVNNQVSNHTTNLNRDVSAKNNACYEVIDLDRINNILSSDVPTTTNPPYYDDVLTKPHIYDQPDEFDNSNKAIAMNTNPSYRVNTGKDRARVATFSTSSDAEAHQPSHSVSTKEHYYDYPYVISTKNVNNDH